jgi:hypothetical protein
VGHIHELSEVILPDLGQFVLRFVPMIPPVAALQKPLLRAEFGCLRVVHKLYLIYATAYSQLAFF